VNKLLSLKHLSVVGLPFISACTPSGMAFSPESAVTQDLIQNQNAVLETTRIHQTQPWRDHSVVLASFMSKQDNKQWSCEDVYDLKRIPTGWIISGSETGCSNPPNTEPVSFGSGSQGEAPEDFSYAYGLVTLDEARWSEITWNDGLVQRVPIVNGSHLALRDGNNQNTPDIKILNVSEEVIEENGITISP